jgi:hypothetical protein
MPYDEVCGKEGSTMRSAGKREANRRRMSVGESSVSTTSPYAVSEDNLIKTLASVGFAP